MDDGKIKLYEEPNKFAESVRFVPGQPSEMFGYQKFFVDNNFIEVHPDDKKLIQKKNLFRSLLNTKWFNNKSVLDLGANSGFFSIYSILKGAKSVTALDMDKQYIDALNSIKKEHNFNNLNIIHDNIINISQSEDFVIAYALIHWLYSCTADYGSLDIVLEKLANMTNDLLLIEWIEPNDDAINFFKHIDFNKEIQVGEYNRVEFERALKKHFYAFKKIAKVSVTRDIYFAVKNPKIIEELNYTNNVLNFWELFSELNENKIPYIVLRNWELLVNNFDFYGDATIEILTNGAGMNHFDFYLANSKSVICEQYSIYKVPIGEIDFQQQFLNFKIILNESNYLIQTFTDMLFASSVRYNYLLGLSAKSLLLYILYSTIYHDGAASNKYLKMLEELGVMTGIKIDLRKLSNFIFLTGVLQYHNITVINYNKFLTPGTYPFLYAPETVFSSRILDRIESEVFLSRIYLLSENVILKQVNKILAKREYDFLTNMDSVFFPKVGNYIEHTNFSTFEVEFINGYLLSEVTKFFSEISIEDFKIFVLDLLTILDELSQQNIVHRDISLENIIVRNKKPVLIDFGWSIRKDEEFITPLGLNKSNTTPEGKHDDIYAMGKVINTFDSNYQCFAFLTNKMTAQSKIDRTHNTNELREIYNHHLNKMQIDIKTSIIIPCHNNISFSKKCIDSIYENTKYESFEIIAIDNASDDGTLEYFEDMSILQDNFKYIHNDSNLSFAQANNQAILYSNNTYVLFLNNDTVVTPKWLEKLHSEISTDESIAVTGCLLLYPNSSAIQHCGVQLGMFQGKKLLYHIYKYRTFSNVPFALESHYSDYLTAACMLVKKDIFNKVGGFDEGYINGFEDIDFCIKVKDAGYKLRYSGSTIVYHYESQTSGRDDYNELNYGRLINKWDSILIPLEQEQKSVINLMDIWLREDIKREPGNKEKIKELLKIARIRNSINEIEEYEFSLMTDGIAKDFIASIIIPVYNNLDYTKKCLISIEKNTKSTYQLIIVNNNSSDGSAEFLNRYSSTRPNVKIIHNNNNVGFAIACNQGAESAESNILVFLNNDTEVEFDWLENGVKAISEDESIGIVGAKLIYPNRTIQHCGIEFQRTEGTYYIWPQHKYRYNNEDEPSVNKKYEPDAVTGACLFIRKEIFEKVDGFTEEYELYFEDTDLCFKVKKNGYKIIYEPSIVAIHHEGKTLNNQDKINDLNLKSAQIFNRKWNNEINDLLLNTFIEKQEGNFIYLTKDFIPDFQNKQSLELFVIFMKNFGDFYLHVGGVGDALLLMSTFYDKNPKSIIFSLSNNIDTMKNLFIEFNELKKVFFIQWENNYYTQVYFRAILPKLNNFKGMGITSENWNNEAEWNNGLDIFQKYGVNPKPNWINQFEKKKICDFQIVIAPLGSIQGMPDWKTNYIDPIYWNNILHFIFDQNINPIVIGTPEEEKFYPLNERCINKRGYDFKEQFEILKGADIVIACDSWHKTFSALAGIKTIVFQTVRKEGYENMQDSSEFVFIYPWKSITLIKSFEDFELAWKKIQLNEFIEKYSLLPYNSLSERFWKTDYNQIKSVLIKSPSAIGDALSITAIVHELKTQFPHLLIGVSGDENAMEIFRYNREINGFTLMDSEEEFTVESISDKVIEYRDIISRLPEYYNKMSFMDILGNLAGIKFIKRDLIYYLTNDEKDFATNEIAHFDKNKLTIGTHLISTKDLRRTYPYREELINQLLIEYNVINLGMEPLGIESTNYFDCGEIKLELRNQIALSSLCDAYLTIDSAFFHIGHNMFKRPTLLIAGPTNPNLIGNPENIFSYIRNEKLNCLNCYWSKECNIECMNELEPQIIFEKFSEYIKSCSIMTGVRNDR